MLNAGRPSTSAAMGGAIGTSYQRCIGQTDSGGSPLAAPSTAASRVGRIVAGLEGLRRLAGGDAQARRAEVVRRRAATHVLPTSVPVPTTTTTRRGRTPVRG